MLPNKRSKINSVPPPQVMGPNSGQTLSNSKANTMAAESCRSWSYSGQTWPNSDQVWSSSGQTSSVSGNFGRLLAASVADVAPSLAKVPPMLGAFRRTPIIVDRVWAKFARIPGRIWPNLADFGPNSAKVHQCWVHFAEIQLMLIDVGRSSIEFLGELRRIWLISRQVWRKSRQCWVHLAEIQPMLVEIWPSSLDSWPSLPEAG